MQRLFLIFCLGLFFSCENSNESNNPENGNTLENLTLSVDTVVVDAGEEIINLKNGGRLASVNESKSHFYLFDDKGSQVQKINLDKLAWEDNIPFEKEGPNGIGTGRHLKVIVYPEENFLFVSFPITGIFSKDGRLLKDLTIRNEEFKIEGQNEHESFNLTSQLTLSDDQKTAFSLPTDFLNGTRKLVKLDLEDSTGKILPIPALDIASEYHIVKQMDDMGMTIYTESIHIQKFGSDVYLLTQSTNKIYQFDFHTDSVQLHEFDFTIVANQKEVPVKNKVKTEEDFASQIEKAKSQINFEKLIYDEQSETFFRFGRKNIPQANKEEQKIQSFLFAFDKDLNLIGETELKGLETLPESPFFKDGKLWSYVNVEDELGFAVFTFDF